MLSAPWDLGGSADLLRPTGALGGIGQQDYVVHRAAVDLNVGDLNTVIDGTVPGANSDAFVEDAAGDAMQGAEQNRVDAAWK